MTSEDGLYPSTLITLERTPAVLRTMLEGLPASAPA